MPGGRVAGVAGVAGGAGSGGRADDGQVPTGMQAKAELRARLRAARRSRTPADLARQGRLLAEVVATLPELAAIPTGGWVSAYVSVGSEPPTGPLLDALVDAGVGVLLPVLLPDLDLDWAAYQGASRLALSAVAARSGLLEPTGPRMGPEALSVAALVLVPCLAIGGGGIRLGQGGGSYDRALRRVGSTVPTAGVVYDSELLVQVPAEPHDRPVTMAVHPAGVVRFGAAAGGMDAGADGVQ